MKTPSVTTTTDQKLDRIIAFLEKITAQLAQQNRSWADRTADELIRLKRK